MEVYRREPFTWAFLDAVAIWAVVVVVAAAVIGTTVTRQVAFGVGCLVAGGIDVAVVHAAVLAARRGPSASRISGRAAALFVLGRMAVKSALLIVAWAVPHTLDFPGTVAGVLAYDLTLTVLGSVLAVRHSFGANRGRTGDGGAL